MFTLPVNSPETLERYAWRTGMVDAGLGGVSLKIMHHYPDHFAALIPAA